MFGDLSSFRAFATARGNSAPANASDADATAALVRASDYIQARYISNFRSNCSGGDVAEGYDPLTLAEVGAYIAASFELDTPNFFNQTYTPSQQKALTAAGSIKWTVVGDKANGTFAASPTLTLLEALYYNCVTDVDRAAAGFWSLGERSANV